MFSLTSLCLQRRTVQEILRKFRVAGAHPDIIFSIDPVKAKTNGDELVRLEEVLAARELGRVSPQYETHVAKRQDFTFWFKDPLYVEWEKNSHNNNISTSRGVATTTPLLPLMPVRGALTPNASDAVFKQQLKELFAKAGINDDFAVGSSASMQQQQGGSSGAADIGEALTTAGRRQLQSDADMFTLLTRADKVVDHLRSYGTLVVVNDHNSSLLVTMPYESHKSHVSHLAQGNPSRKLTHGAIVGASGEIAPDAMKFVDDHGLRAFELRVASSAAGAEQFVSAFERLDHIFTVHRGKAMRSAVAIVLSLDAQLREPFVADDGCIVLPIVRQDLWEMFLLGLPTLTWMRCVEAHTDWRQPPALKFEGHRRLVKKMADLFGVFRVVLETKWGTSDRQWQENLLNLLQKEEPAIRKTIQKYNIRSPSAKKHGFIYFMRTLQNAAGDSIDYKLSDMGHIFFNASTITPPKILRVLRDHLVSVMKRCEEYNALLSRLIRVGYTMNIEFCIDERIKRSRDGTLVEDVTGLVQRLEAHSTEISGLLSRAVGAQRTARLTFVVSDYLDVSPMGVVYIPYDIDLQTLKQRVIPAFRPQ